MWPLLARCHVLGGRPTSCSQRDKTSKLTLINKQHGHTQPPTHASLCPWHWSLWPLPTASVVAYKAGFLGAPQWEVGLGKLL